MTEWQDTSELAGRSLDYQTRGDAAMFALDVKKSFEEALLDPNSNIDDAERARLTLAARFASNRVLGPTMTGEIDPELCAFLAITSRVAEIKQPESPSVEEPRKKTLRQRIGDFLMRRVDYDTH